MRVHYNDIRNNIYIYIQQCVIYITCVYYVDKVRRIYNCVSVIRTRVCTTLRESLNVLVKIL